MAFIWSERRQSIVARLDSVETELNALKLENEKLKDEVIKLATREATTTNVTGQTLKQQAKVNGATKHKMQLSISSSAARAAAEAVAKDGKTVDDAEQIGNAAATARAKSFS